MKKIRIHFDMDLDYISLKYFDTLPGIKNNFEFVVDRVNPQIVFYYNRNQIKNPVRSKFKCKHLLFCYEYMVPNMRMWDYALQWNYTSDPRQLRFPNYVHFGAGEDLVKPTQYDPEKILRSKTKFCAFVQYSSNAYRNQFFDLLNAKKHVDSPGRQRNNLPTLGGHKNVRSSRYDIRSIEENPNILGWVADLRNFLKDYKFVITFENRITSGYTTEKIYNPMVVNCLPIYLGAPDIQRDFNPKSFVHVRNFFSKNVSISTGALYPKEFSKAVQYILELDKNDKAYCNTLAQPWYYNNMVSEYANKDNISNFFTRVFNDL